MTKNVSEQCAITKSSSGAEFPKLAITALSYGAELNFTCPDEGLTSVKCAEPGLALLVECQGEVLNGFELLIVNLI